MKGWSRRWWGWLAAVVLAVLAIQWGDSADAPPARDGVDLAPAQPPRGASPASTPAPVVFTLIAMIALPFIPRVSWAMIGHGRSIQVTPVGQAVVLPAAL